MWIIKAPVEKFGIIPHGKTLHFNDVKFFNNVGFCPKYYHMKYHVMSGCIDVTPRILRIARKGRRLANILVVAKGGIGDVLWIFPFIRELKRINEQSQIAVLTDDRCFPLFLNFPYITCPIKDEMWNAQSLFDASDEIYDFGGMVTVHDDLKKLDPVERPFKIAEMKLPKEKKMLRPHIVLTALEGQEAIKMVEDFKINISEDKIITIATESSTANRDWPLMHIYALSRRLALKGYKIIFLSAKKEQENLRFIMCGCGWSCPINAKDLPKEIIFSCPQCQAHITEKIDLLGSNIINLSGKTSLRQYMSLIALSDLFIGPNSSGIVISTALEIPTIGLFGAFDPVPRTKYYDKFFYITGKAKCFPCGEHWTECKEGHPAPCMRSITPDMVYDAALDMIKRYPRDARTKKPGY